jgi:hypothetical protein
MILATAAHRRTTAAIQAATAAVKSTDAVMGWGVTSAIIRDVLKTIAGARPHARGYSVQNNPNHRGGSRRCAAVNGARSLLGHHVGPCRGPAPHGVHGPPGALVRTLAPASHRYFPAHFRRRRTREQPPLWAQFVLSVRRLSARKNGTANPPLPSLKLTLPQYHSYSRFKRMVAWLAYPAPLGRGYPRCSWGDGGCEKTSLLMQSSFLRPKRS